MNIIVIVSDTFRRDFLGCYGNDWIHTPNIDRFAKRSTVFDKAYIGSFPTVPQRYDLFTGRYCFHTRGWAPLDPKEDTFPKMLKREGYYAKAVFDTPHIVYNSMNFDKSFDDWHYMGSKIFEKDLPKNKRDVEVPCSLSKFRFVKEAAFYSRLVTLKEDEHFCARTMLGAAEWLEKDMDEYDKFLLYADTFDPHEPWVPPDNYVNLYDPNYEEEIIFSPRYDYSGYLTAPELKHMRALYAGMVTLVDKWVGFLLDKIEERGLFDEAAVIFTSDHGFYHGEHGRVGKHTVLNPKDGWPLYEEVSSIPLIISARDLPKSTRCDALIQPVDIMATILDLAGVPTPKGLHGRSILPILRGEKESIREIAVSSGGPYFQHDIARPPPHIKHQFTLSPDPEYVSHSTITDGKWALLYATEGVPAELYNLQKDYKQERNVISENRGIAKELHRKFYQYLEDIGTSSELLKIRERL